MSFKPCDECETPEACDWIDECAIKSCEGPAPSGFNFTREEEERLDDPRRGQGVKRTW